MRARGTSAVAAPLPTPPGTRQVCSVCVRLSTHDARPSHNCAGGWSGSPGGARSSGPALILHLRAAQFLEAQKQQRLEQLRAEREAKRAKSAPAPDSAPASQPLQKALSYREQQVRPPARPPAVQAHAGSYREEDARAHAGSGRNLT